MMESGVQTEPLYNNYLGPVVSYPLTYKVFPPAKKIKFSYGSSTPLNQHNLLSIKSSQLEETRGINIPPRTNSPVHSSTYK